MYASTILLSWQHNDYTWDLSHHIWHHSHCICVITQMARTSVSMHHSIDDITTSVYNVTFGTRMASHSHFMTSMIMFYDITNTAFMTSDFFSMTSHPLFRKSHHFMYDINSTLSDLTSTVSVSSNPSYRWHHSHYMNGITSSISVTSYPL